MFALAFVLAAWILEAASAGVGSVAEQVEFPVRLVPGQRFILLEEMEKASGDGPARKTANWYHAEVRAADERHHAVSIQPIDRPSDTGGKRTIRFEKQSIAYEFERDRKSGAVRLKNWEEVSKWALAKVDAEIDDKLERLPEADRPKAEQAIRAQYVTEPGITNIVIQGLAGFFQHWDTTFEISKPQRRTEKNSLLWGGEVTVDRALTLVSVDRSKGTATIKESSTVDPAEMASFMNRWRESLTDQPLPKPAPEKVEIRVTSECTMSLTWGIPKNIVTTTETADRNERSVRSDRLRVMDAKTWTLTP